MPAVRRVDPGGAEGRDSLKAYAEGLSALAGDGVSTRLDDDYDTLAARLVAFSGASADKTSAIASFANFVTRPLIGRLQSSALQEALDHEEAVDTLADALVLFADRAYGTPVTQLYARMDAIRGDLRTSTMPPLLVRMRIVEIEQERDRLAGQVRVADQLMVAVAQMKTTSRISASTSTGSTTRPASPR